MINISKLRMFPDLFADYSYEDKGAEKNHIPDDILLFFNHDINIWLYHPMDMATELHYYLCR